ncbi:MAG: RlmE family RNA methyltransferase [Rectinemataceae bacterium]|nr:RlmE family RNA methyltransferase [Spirochaetaceae bacterium]
MAGYERPDHWTQKAKKEGYPARSVYKLEEIVRKFALMKRGASLSVLDVGAAPGSWSLWLLRTMQGTGRLVAVDIQDLGIHPEAPSFTFVKGSILDDSIRTRLRELGPYQMVVSDAAPATTGNRLVDQARSEELVEAVLHLALEVLAPGGALVMKIFQGGEEKRLLAELRQHFAQARGFKPEACRAESFETYLVATGFRSPLVGSDGQD